MCNFFLRVFCTLVILAMFFSVQSALAQNSGEPLEAPKRPQITTPSRGVPNPVALRATYSDNVKELAKIEAMLPQLGENDQTLIDTLHSQQRALRGQQNQIAAQLRQLGFPLGEANTQINATENSAHALPPQNSSPEKIALPAEIAALRVQISSLQEEVSTLRSEMQKLTALMQTLLQQLSPPVISHTAAQ